MIPELEFQHLSYFLAVARAGNFTSAAKSLGTSQSTLSRAISKLEEQIGQPLFERKPRGVTLTDLGELFLSRSQEILDLVEDTFSELSDSGKSGRVRLGIIPTIAPFFLPGVLSSFAKVYPNVSVTVVEDTTDNLIQSCNYGELDLAVLALPITVKYLEVEPLFDEELVLVMPHGHELEGKEEITLSDIESEPFVMLSEAHCLSEHISSFCRMKSVQPISIERTSQLATVQELVSLGHGISMVPKMAQDIDNSGRRIYRDLSEEKPMRTIALLGNPYRYQSHWVQIFKKHLQKVCVVAK